MKHLKKFNEHNKYNNASLNIGGLKCDHCDWSDMTIPLSDYEKYIGSPCPKCGENILTQEDYDETMNMVQAVEIVNMYSPEDLEKIAGNLSSEEMDGALDMINKWKLKNDGTDTDGREIWRSHK